MEANSPVFSVIMSFLALLLSVSCSREEGPTLNPDIIYVYSEKGDCWHSGDKLSIVGSSAATFTAYEASENAKGLFSGSLSDAGKAPFYAIFPENGNATVSAEGISFPIPRNCVTPMVGKLLGSKVFLSNLMGFLKVEISSGNSVNIKKISLHDLSGNMLWGDCFIPIQADTLAVDNMILTNGDNTIDLEFNNYETIGPSGSEFTFPMPPGSLDHGFSLVFYEYDPTKPGSVGRAYAFISETESPKAAVRSATAEIDLSVLVGQPEPYDAKARGYYKSLFIDAGVDLLEYYKSDSLPFIENMGFAGDYEYFASNVTNEAQAYIQNQCFDKTTVGGLGWSDQNGQLLYPDGEPRFRMIYVNGGSSKGHGQSLTKQALDNVNTFYKNGGSYVGTCAGAFMATTWYGQTLRYGNADPADDCSFGIWPGSLSLTRLPVTINSVTVDGKKYDGWGTVVTGMKVVSDNLGDYSFALNDTIQDNWQLGGCYMAETAANLAYIPDILMRYQFTDTKKAQSRPAEYCYTRENLDKTDFPNPFFAYNSSGVATHSKNIVDSVACFAYKESPASGRAVLTGSHPEHRKPGGKQLAMMKMMVKYALEGNGDPTIKGSLKLNGEGASAKIGDKQYHHFTFTSDKNLENIRIVLNCDSSSDIDLHLALKKDGFAWRSDADYIVCSSGGNKTLDIKHLPAGKWYISVYCATTVDAVPTEDGTHPSYYIYKGHTEVLDGITYNIAVRTGTP